MIESFKKKYLSPPTRLILLTTHNCQLRCQYCRVKKFSASMSKNVLFKAINLLFNFDRKNLQLQFFGGEPLLEFNLIKKGVEYAEKLNQKFNKNLAFVLTTNGILLDKEKIDFFKKHKFLLECSIDEEKIRNRKYSPAIKNFNHLIQSNIPHYSISVFTPNNVTSMFRTFKYLVDFGFKKIQLNYCLGVFWEKEKTKELVRQFNKILGFLNSKKDIQLINSTPSRQEPVILNGELTVDCNGDLYLEFGGFLEENFFSLKKKFLIGPLDKIKTCTFRSLTPSLSFLYLMKAYPRGEIKRVILNNISVGKTIEKLFKNFQNEKNK